jgi:adenine-specific DNA methylase
LKNKVVDHPKGILGESYFPVEEVSKEAIKEKKGRSPIFEMHFWWGRKPLIAARSAILAASLPASEKEQLLDYLGLSVPISKRKKRAYTYSVSTSVLEPFYTQTFAKNRPLLLDPFAGGGSIPYEALRLGFDVVACDYNPVSWLILNAIMGYPKRLGDLLPQRIEQAFNELIEKLSKSVEKYYPKDEENFTSTYMYAWSIACPYCDRQVPLVNNWVLKKKPVKKSNKRFNWIYMVPNYGGDQFSVTVYEEENLEIPTMLEEGTVIRGKAKCPYCLNVIPNSFIVKDIKKYQTEIPLILVQIREGAAGRVYKPFDSANLRVWKERQSLLSKIRPGILPEFAMPKKIVPAARYLGTWDQLTNERQRFFFYKLITTAIQIAQQKQDEWGEDWGQAVALYFALLMGKSIDFNSRCTSWASKEGIRNSLAFRRPSMVWDHCEINPFSPKGSGNLQTIKKNIIAGIKQACIDLKNTPGSIDIRLGSILNLDLPQADLIVTDPPYADDVQYPELSEFFYAWEQSIVTPFFPNLPKGSPPNTEDLSANNTDRSTEFVEFGLSLAFSKVYEALQQSGRLSLFFAHGSLSVWSFVVNALIKSGFTITSTFPVHTESRDNVIALGKASFMTSTLINAVRRAHDRVAYYEEIEDEIKEHAKLMINEYLEYGLRGSDLTMAALGPVLKKISEYKEIKSITGRFQVTDTLRLTSEILFQQILGEEILLSVDGATRGYLYSRLSGQLVMTHDVLQQVAKSLGISIDLLRDSTLFKEQKRDNKNRTRYDTISYAKFRVMP